MTHKVPLALAIRELYARRGLFPVCKDCPVNLFCLQGRPLGYHCPTCNKFYIKVAHKRLDCDAVRVEDSTEQGRCPSCDNGEQLEVLIGVQLDWNTVQT